MPFVTVVHRRSVIDLAPRAPEWIGIATQHGLEIHCKNRLGSCVHALLRDALRLVWVCLRRETRARQRRIAPRCGSLQRCICRSKHRSDVESAWVAAQAVHCDTRARLRIRQLRPVKPVYSQLGSAVAHSQSRPGRAPDNCNDCTEALPSRSPVRVPLVDWLPGGPLHYYQPRRDWYQYQQVAVAARGRAGGTSALAWPSVACLFVVSKPASSRVGEQVGEQPTGLPVLLMMTSIVSRLRGLALSASTPGEPARAPNASIRLQCPGEFLVRIHS
jgi:hypothetical protein